MKCIKIIKFVGAIALLMMIPIIPLTAAKFQDDRLLGQLKVEQVQNENKDVQASDLSISEKLELISSYGNRDKNIVVTNQVQDMSDQNVALIRDTINGQLELLQDLGIKIASLDELSLCNEFVLKRYSNAIDPKQSVALYQVSFSSGNNLLRVLIDVETKKIFGFDCYDKTVKLLDVDLIEAFGCGYLGLTIDEMEQYYLIPIDKRGTVMTIMPIYLYQ